MWLRKPDRFQRHEQTDRHQIAQYYQPSSKSLCLSHQLAILRQQFFIDVLGKVIQGPDLAESGGHKAHHNLDNESNSYVDIHPLL